MIKMFQSALYRLTISYLAIVMFLSVGFSIVLYRSLTNELKTGLGRQAGIFQQLPYGGNFEEIRKQQLDEASQRVLWELAYFNLLILVAGGLASYALARLTLQPIQEAHEAQARFTADASHELRTPLAVMRTEIEVALRESKMSASEARELLASNLEEVAKLETLSSSLLKLSQAEHSEIILKEQPLRPILEEVEARIAERAKKRGVRIVMPETALIVQGDREGLVELLVILIDNAIKYSSKDSQVNVTVAKRKQTVRISVADQGQGIKASDIPYLFNRFYRADRSRTKEQVDGYGLGLSIAKSIADRHKGAIEVSSQVGKGSSFTIVLPDLAGRA